MFLFSAYVGPMEEKGEEAVYIQICTPQWLLTNLGKDEIICGKGYLIVREYNFEKILGKIKELIESCHGKDWKEIGEKLSYIGHWEFENYKK